MFGNNISCKNLVLGTNVVIEDTAIIRGLKGPAENIFIGDNTYIGHNVQIICDNFKIGDYGKIHHDTNIHGYKPCSIGHNAWIGQFCIIDSIGGTTIGNNCGIGAHSQLWSHIKYGDTLEGCRFLNESPLQVGNDVWFVGHCIVSPIIAEDKSMALVGSVVTKNMKENHVYAGSPAKDVTNSIGNQFETPTIDQKLRKMNLYLKQFEELTGNENHDILIVENKSQFVEDKTCFSVSDRTYNKRMTASEQQFIRFLLPEKAKFIPNCL